MAKTYKDRTRDRVGNKLNKTRRYNAMVHNRRKRSGYTLVELLGCIVCVVGASLAIILMVALILFLFRH